MSAWHRRVAIRLGRSGRYPSHHLGDACACVTNAKIEARKRDAREAEARLEDLSAQLELRTEELGQIESKLEKTRASIARTERELERARRDLVEAQDQLATRASSIYRNGRLDPVAFFVGVTDFADLLTRVELYRRIGRQDADMVSAVREAKHRVELSKAKLEQRESEQAELRVKARAKQAQVGQALKSQAAYLASIRADVGRLIAEERARQAKIEAERARELAEALRLAQARRRITQPRIDVSRLGRGHSCRRALGHEVPGRAVRVGRQTPSGFDCSGLVQYCYSQVGVEVPRTARDQYFAGSPIPPDRLDLLQPGDLVFFAYDNDPRADPSRRHLRGQRQLHPRSADRRRREGLVAPGAHLGSWRLRWGVPSVELVGTFAGPVAAISSRR